MAEFVMNVMRNRTVVSEFGASKPGTDEVVLDVDDLGRIRTQVAGRQVGATRFYGGTLCYHGWKLLTGIPLQPFVVYKVKVSMGEATKVGDVLTIESFNSDLGDPEEVVKRDDAENAEHVAWQERLREAKAKRKAQSSK